MVEMLRVMSEEEHLRSEMVHMMSEEVHLMPEEDYLKLEEEHLKSEEEHLKSEEDYLKPEEVHLKSEEEHLKSEEEHLKFEEEHLKSEMERVRLRLSDRGHGLLRAKRWGHRMHWQENHRRLPEHVMRFGEGSIGLISIIRKGTSRVLRSMGLRRRSGLAEIRRRKGAVIPQKIAL